MTVPEGAEAGNGQPPKMASWTMERVSLPKRLILMLNCFLPINVSLDEISRDLFGSYFAGKGDKVIKRVGVRRFRVFTRERLPKTLQSRRRKK